MLLLASDQLLNKVLGWWHHSINREFFSNTYRWLNRDCFTYSLQWSVTSTILETRSKPVWVILNLWLFWIWGQYWSEELKKKKKKKKNLSFLPRQQRPFSHCYLVSLFWVVSPDRELVSYNSIITLSNSPSSLLLFKVVQNSAEHCRHLDSALRAGSWNKTMPTDFKAISFPLWKFLLLILNRFTEWNLTSC